MRVLSPFKNISRIMARHNRYKYVMVNGNILTAMCGDIIIRRVISNGDIKDGIYHIARDGGLIPADIMKIDKADWFPDMRFLEPKPESQFKLASVGREFTEALYKLCHQIELQNSRTDMPVYYQSDWHPIIFTPGGIAAKTITPDGQEFKGIHIPMQLPLKYLVEISPRDLLDMMIELNQYDSYSIVLDETLRKPRLLFGHSWQQCVACCELERLEFNKE